MSNDSVITVKMPRELKERMKKADVNWSEYVRESVRRRLEQEELRRVSAELDSIRSRSKPVSTRELVSWIREDRRR